MNKENYPELIKKIKELTEKDITKWKRIKNYIDIYSKENGILRKYIETNKEYDYTYKKDSPSKEIDIQESFFADINNGKIFLFKKIYIDAEKYILAIQSNIDSNILEININEEYQEELLVLKYLIISKIDNIDKFLDGILNM